MLKEGFSGFENSEQNEYVEGAQKALENFVQLKPEEKVLFLTEPESNRALVDVLSEAVKKIGSVSADLPIDKKTRKNQIEKAALDSDVVFDLTTETEKTMPLYEEDFLENNKYRLVSFADLDKDVFSKDGAMTEDVRELESRLDRMEDVLKKAKGFRMRSAYGTQLEIGIRPFGERQWFKDTGFIDQPGKWDNIPGGEIFTTPDESSVNGVLVLPVLDSTIIKEQGVDELVRVTIRNGIISSIQGGRSAEIMRKKLEQEALTEIKGEENPPLNVYRIAELSFGANSKARSAVRDPGQAYDSPAVSIVEAEKRFGTMHIAFGTSKHGEEGTEGFEDPISHYDFVIPRNGLTVEMFETEDDFRKKTNGRKIISEGNLHFFD